MKKLTIENMGDEVQGVRLYGDPKRRPEPTYFRVEMPFATVDIARCDDGSYWVHVIRAKASDVVTELKDLEGRFMEARLHSQGQHSSQADLGDFERPDLYDVALRIGPAK